MQLAVAQPATAHQVKIDKLEAAKRYFFIIASTNSGKTSYYRGSFTTLGLPVKLLVGNSQRKAVAAAQVTVADVTKVTKSDGSAEFRLPAGSAKASVQVGKKVSQFGFSVKPSTDPDPQEQTFNFTVVTSTTSIAKILLVVVVALLLIGAVLWRLLGRRRAPADVQPGYDVATMPPPVLAMPELPTAPKTLISKEKLREIRHQKDHAKAEEQPKDLFEEGQERLEHEGYIKHPDHSEHQK